MKDRRSRVLLFDLGGVLVENAGREALRSLLPEGATPGDLGLRWLSCPHVAAFERGHTDRHAFARDLVRDWNLTIPAERFIAHFASWPRGFYPGAEDLVRDLRRNYRVACLSNSNEVHWERFPGLEAMFDHAFASHRIGHVKPDPKVFAHALDALAVPPEACHFFDDLQPNVDAARAAGMHAHRVEGLDELRAALRSEGLAAR